MEIVFNAIGIDVPNEAAFQNLARNAGRNGEASIAARSGRIVRGRCWRIGSGLEVWTDFNESETGEISYSHCRPAFRARHTQILSDWFLLETKGDIAVEGCIGKSATKIFFQLQNLTEINSQKFEQKTLRVGLCGLAYRAELSTKKDDFFRTKPKQRKADWHLCGKILAFQTIRNPFTHKDLYWIYLDLNDFELEVLVNQCDLRGGDLQIGRSVEADVWLQGHIVSQSMLNSNYEGVDWSQGASEFWKKFKREN